MKQGWARLVDFPDGLYRVIDEKKGICAGFEVRHGTVMRCAPVLRKHLLYWLQRAVRVK